MVDPTEGTSFEIDATWEAVVTDGNFVTARLRVPGGWIVRISNGTDASLTAVFVADPNNQWVIA